MRRTLLLVAPLALIAAFYGIAQIPNAVSGYTGSISDDGTNVTLTGRKLLFSADNTYDIGASGSRPHDLFLGHNLTANDVASSFDVHAGATGALYWTNRSAMKAPADGQITLMNNAQTAFTSLQFGGTTSSFPELKRTGNALAIRQADDTVPTFSTLTACASSLEGAMAPVSDSTTATWGATITGSGANHVLAYCDGTNWTVAAK